MAPVGKGGTSDGFHSSSAQYPDSPGPCVGRTRLGGATADCATYQDGVQPEGAQTLPKQTWYAARGGVGMAGGPTNPRLPSWVSALPAPWAATLRTSSLACVWYSLPCPGNLGQ